MLDLGDVVPVIEEFSKQSTGQLWHWITVIDITHRYFRFQQFSLVIDDQVQLEFWNQSTLVFSQVANSRPLHSPQNFPPPLQ